ncbi:MAG: bifunctional riboflavin kinase/FAD synthetase [Rhodospirillaceae bacterium]
MRVFRHYDELPANLRGACVALGNFDGVHRGHRAVIGAAKKLAARNNAPFGVLTFDPHPRRVFKPDLPPFALSSFRMKVRLMEEQGADFFCVQHFDEDFAGASPDWFIETVLVKGLKVRAIAVGEDFAFGNKRMGNVALLRDRSLELIYEVVALSAVSDADGTALSSTRIRNALASGDLDIANHILGRPWEIEGRVEHGDARGRTIGFPTANVRLGDFQRPRTGVYAVTAGPDEGPDTVWTPGVANFGNRPTVDGKTELLEVHLFDTDRNLYGIPLRIRFHAFLRPEQKFADLDALKTQIAADAHQARALLAQHLPAGH